MLMLDCLDPPTPAELVADCQQVGAGAVARYWWRPMDVGGWTPAHEQALHSAGIQELYIVVPGNTPPDPSVTLAGLGAVPVAVDLETGSLPPASWVASWIASARAQGCRPLRYGDQPVLARYPPADGEWWSHGAIPVRTGQLLPVPPLPAGLVADQYSVKVYINGHEYDASVVDPNLWAATAPLLREDKMKILTIGSQQHLLGVNSAGVLRHLYNDSGTSPPTGWQENDTGITGLVPYAPFDAELLGTQLHVVTADQSGNLVHAWQD